MATRTKRPKYPTIPLQKVVLVRDKSVAVPEHISGAWQAAEIARNLTKGSPDESLMVFCLDNHHKLLCAQVIATGSPAGVAFTPAQVFRAAILTNATAVIVAHNHPSGHCELSNDDLATYTKLVAASNTLGIPVLDFIVVVDGSHRYASVHD